MKTIHDLGWRYWLATAFLLAGWLSGWTPGIWLAIVLCIVQIAHFAKRTGRLTSFLVQVRMAYLVLLIAGLWPPLISGSMSYSWSAPRPEWSSTIVSWPGPCPWLRGTGPNPGHWTCCAGPISRFRPESRPAPGQEIRR
ncbi:MAG TPA: hypothetical protein VLA99_09125 [Nitrospiraceae bacterium]|nr:hypothetical protein [Nitrospiraceae bacterium]